MLTRRRFLNHLAAGIAVGSAPRLLGQIGGEADAPSLLNDRETWRSFRAAVARRPASQIRLAAEAGDWRQGQLLSIVSKRSAGPSGDLHDYVSLSPYSWPDPAKPDGLPWITRDGQVNPEFYQFDSPMLERLCRAVPILVLNAVAGGAQADLRRAGQLLRTWFIAPATRMNPNLNYAQNVPGAAAGTAKGIIDATSLIFLADAAVKLPFNSEWTASDLTAVKIWFSAYVDWLLTSKLGREEGRAPNNHGSWYDAQVVCFSAFSGRSDLARHRIEHSTLPRIAVQIEPDGRQPLELRRTLSLTYSTYNLLAHACTARIAAGFGIDLWSWKSPTGSSLQGAMNWHLPFYARSRPWSHQQIHAFDFSSAAVLLNLAWQSTGRPELARISDATAEEPWQKLLFSKASLTGRDAPRPI